MISLFKKTRKWLLKQNNFGRYFIYAIGEIILIVIGILIALTINNWNELRKVRERESFYLHGLKEEFEQSRIKLEVLAEVNRNNIEDTEKLASMINNPNSTPSEGELSLLMFNALANEISYNPNNSLLNEMINSGGLNSISNPELRKHLTRWESFIQSVHRQEDNLRLSRDMVYEIFNNDTYSIKTIFDQTGISAQLGIPASGSRSSNKQLLSSNTFENSLLIYLLTEKNLMTEHYNPLFLEIDYILDLLDTEINMQD